MNAIRSSPCLCMRDCLGLSFYLFVAWFKVEQNANQSLCDLPHTHTQTNAHSAYTGSLFRFRFFIPSFAFCCYFEHRIYRVFFLHANVKNIDRERRPFGCITRIIAIISRSPFGRTHYTYLHFSLAFRRRRRRVALSLSLSLLRRFPFSTSSPAQYLCFRVYSRLGQRNLFLLLRHKNA